MFSSEFISAIKKLHPDDFLDIKRDLGKKSNKQNRMESLIRWLTRPEECQAWLSEVNEILEEEAGMVLTLEVQ